VSETPEQLVRQAAELIHRASELNREQITRQQLDGMSPDEINAARRAGRLRDLINTAPEPNTIAKRAAQARLAGLTDQEINDQRRRGSLDDILNPKGHNS
jgi:methylphosphotriester-DNA--protein-cysteine methyltransferase